MDMGKNFINKTEYIFADYFRLICAIGVVALHLDPFYDINKSIDFFVGSVLTRLCVPFFFIVSGFFLKDKFDDWSRLKKYVGHLIKLYVVYSMLYLPVNYYEYKEDGRMLGEMFGDFFRKFFFVGSYGQLWYFLALIFASLFLYLLITIFGLNDKLMMTITVILFLMGLFFRVYDKPIRDAVDEIKIVALYDSIFKTTRNGLFFGTPFVYWGNLIWKKKIDVNRKKCGLLFGIAMLAFTAEAIFVRNIIGARQLDMLLLLPVTSILFVVLVLSKEKEIEKHNFSIWCRKLSVLVFGFHMLINFCINRIVKFVESDINSLCLFFVVLIVNILLGILLIFFSKRKYGKWIEKVFL